MLAPDLFRLDYVSPTDFGPTNSFVFGVAILGVGVGGAVAGLLFRAWQLMRAQRELNEMVRVGAGQALTAGPNRVVKGVVEATDGSPPVAIAIEILQHVENKTSKNSTWHEWKEDERKVEAGPFYLVREDGESVYVEPNKDVLVIDGLETSLPPHLRMKRLRIADVKQGEVFYVSGDLHRGAHPRARSAYRDGAQGWVLRPPRRDRMLLATTLLGSRYTDRARSLRNAGFVFAALFVLMHAALTFPFLVANMFGGQATGVAVSSRTYTTRSKSTTITHHMVMVRMDDGYAFESEVPRATWNALAKESMPSVPVLYTPSYTRATFLGYQPSTNLLGLIFSAFGWALAFIVFGAVHHAKVPWYDRKKLNERGGTGFWSDPR